MLYAKVTLKKICPLIKILKLCQTNLVITQTNALHQIRVHLSSIGHALLGDSLYGKKSNLISHTALVCKEMHFTMPDGRNIDLSIPFPKDFEKLLRD